MTGLFAGLAILAVWSSLAFAQAPTFPMSETGDDQREYAIRAPLTSGDGLRWMGGGGMVSCKLLKGKTRQHAEDQFTTEGKALCHRLSKVKGLVDVKVQDYTVQITKAKAFSWEELDAALQQSFTGL